jgi:hypothetical protein
MHDAEAGVQCVTWRQFQLGIAAVFIANCFFSLVVAFAVAQPSRPQNNNTNIVNTPHEELRSRLSQQYLKEITDGMRSGTNSTGERSSGMGTVPSD